MRRRRDAGFKVTHESMAGAMTLRRLQSVYFRGEDEIAFGEPVNFVRPRFHFRFSPGQKYIRVMPLLLRNLAYFIHESEGLAKVRKLKLAHDVMPFDNLPLRRLFRQILQFLSAQRRNSAAARYAGFIR
jgi:hypothetical protein